MLNMLACAARACFGERDGLLPGVPPKNLPQRPHAPRGCAETEKPGAAGQAGGWVTPNCQRR